jgi:hypothetical protein
VPQTDITFRWESDLSDSFCARLPQLFPAERGSQTHTVLESTCSNGRADLVYARFAASAPLDFLRERAHLLARTLHSRILARIGREGATTLEQLQLATGVTPRTLRRALGELDETELLLQDGVHWRLTAPARLPQVHIDAFEFKLSGWRRALYQAARYRVFSHRVYVVLPPETSVRASEARAAFTVANVGLLLYDDDGYCEELVRPKKREPVSKQHLYRAVGMLLRQKRQ